MKSCAKWMLALFVVSSATAARGDHAAADRAKEAAALRALDVAWSEAAGKKDLDAVVSYMADDGQTLAPNEALASDKAAIRASWANILKLPDVKISWKPLRAEVAASGDLGFTSGSYSLSFSDAAGKTVTDTGKYLEVWEKIDGKWKCAADAFNSDLPLP